MIEGWLCGHCRAKANGIIGAWVAIWIALFVGSIAVLFQGINLYGPYENLFYLMVLLLVISIFGCPLFVYYRASPITHFIQIKPNLFNFDADPVFHCHNSKYNAILKFLNPGLDIQANHPGNGDDKDFVEKYIAHASQRVQQFPRYEQPAPRNAKIPWPDLERQARCPACGHVNIAPPGRTGSFVLYCEQCGAKLR